MDANLLDSRLRCLREEDSKTQRKIEVTRKKTEQKMNTLQEKDEKAKQKSEFRERRERELQEKKEQNRLQKERHKMAINMANEINQKETEKTIKFCNDCPFFERIEDTSVVFDSFDDPSYEFYCKNPDADNSETELSKENIESKKYLGGSLSRFGNQMVPRWCPFKKNPVCNLYDKIN